MMKTLLKSIPGGKQVEAEAADGMGAVIGVLRAQIQTGTPPDKIVQNVRAVALQTFSTPVELAMCRRQIAEVLMRDAVLKPQADSMAKRITQKS